MSTAGPVAVEVPDIGDFEGVPVIEIHVAPGDRVSPEDPLVTLESDKATMDVPAPVGGIVHALSVKVGDRVSQGDLLLTLEPADAAAAADAVASAERAEAAAAPGLEPDATPAPAPPPTPAPEPAPTPPDGRAPIYASPSVRRLARELSLDLTRVQGTGRKGRITREDVEAFAGRGPAPPPASAAVPAPPPGAPPAEERVALKRIQRIAAPRLSHSWTTIPHVTQHDEADITELEAWRRRLNQRHASDEPPVKFTMVSFLVLASVATLKEFPAFNSSLDGEELILKRHYDIGFAADTPNGLLVPVIRQADRKGLLEIARELAELSARARAGKLGPAEMSGATFTISSLGGIGGTAFTPIVNAPEVAILGVSRAAMKPVWNGQEFVPRLMLPLSLSYDHRVIDGAAAARFVVHLSGVLGDLRQALL